MKRFRSIKPLLPVLMAALLAGCSNPVEDDEDHPVGLVVLNAQNQQVAGFTVAGGATGQISVSRAAPATFQVFAVSEDGDRIDIDGEVGLKAAVVGGVASAAIQSENRLVVTGTQTGTGTLQLTLTHEGHDEFRADLPLTVGS